MTEPVPDVVVVGNLTIDDIVRPDGRTLMATPGGNVLHAAIAARIWGIEVGVVARRGDDFPASTVDAVRDAGIAVDGLRRIDGATVRNWVLYEDDGRRHWVYRTPPGRSAEVAPVPADVPPAWTTARVVHVAAMPLAAATRLVEHLRGANGGGSGARPTITLDTHEDWRATTVDIVALARQVDVFVPSHEELATLTGEADVERAAQRLLDEGVPALVVKCGADGAVVGVAGEPLVRVAAAPVTVVDETGAGDSFCGGLAAGLALGESLVVAARRGAATAGAALGASGSLRLLTRASIAARLLTDTASADPAAAPDDDGQPDDSDVMEQELASIPAVIRARIERADQAAPTVERMRADGVRQIVLVGCGDSAFAGQAAALALARSTNLPVRYEHALDFARYSVRYLPQPSAVVVISYSGKTGRTIEAAHQARQAGHLVVALTGAPDGPLASLADVVLPAEIPTYGFSPGTSTYTALLVTLLTLAVALDTDAARADSLRRRLHGLADLAEQTIAMADAPARRAAEALRDTALITFLGAGPNEATARFGAAKLFEGSQQLAMVTNVEEWAHEQYFVTNPGDPIVVVAPSGAASDRTAEILDEINYVGASAIVVSDAPPAGPGLHLPIAGGAGEDLSPVLAAIPLGQLGLHLMRLRDRRSYNFPDAAAKREHYDTIHRATIGVPA